MPRRRASRSALINGVQPTSRPTVGSPATGSNSRKRHMLLGRDWMAARVRRLLDAVVIIDDFQRAEVEFADVIGGQRIFPSAFAALERLHETGMFFHNRSTGTGRQCPVSSGEEVSKRLFSFFPGGRKNRLRAPGWNWHLARRLLPPVAVVSSGQSLHHSE